MAKKVIKMAWSKVTMEIAKTGAEDAFSGDAMTNIGIIKDKSTTLEYEEGEKLQARETGNVVVAEEEGEGLVYVKTRLIEPDNEFLKLLGIGEEVTSEPVADKGDFRVKTHIVSENWSLRLTPKNVGAMGLKVPVTHISIVPGYSEEEGHYMDVRFNFIMGAQGYLYARFAKKAQ